MDEILKMSDKVDSNNLIYNFKGPTSSIKSGKFGGPMYIYGHMKNGDTTLQQVEKRQKDLHLKRSKRIKWNNIRKSEA